MRGGDFICLFMSASDSTGIPDCFRIEYLLNRRCDTNQVKIRRGKLVQRLEEENRSLRRISEEMKCKQMKKEERNRDLRAQLSMFMAQMQDRLACAWSVKCPRSADENRTVHHEANTS